ncbi:hypothetical protein LPB72_03460 [Hydrogenophaga crassostreae]|uniref:DUF4038 domain-containing protein n=1 Tax=Hydrogenophaga crassostreae TaxID=1763535 RepID=A0A167IUE1_9BURK|nr:DUF4038 domain-containing protein [Hydrogenophaga crassostreae]AOW14377.1 hypothetical protein LPB072_17575 [Hydrogenophaga crassostreae]OAD43599.1 hypothetical protein LPB72_03460 [Hydrogenophaga crassostreae]
MNPDTATANHLIEIEFCSGKAYQDPFVDVILDVTFTEPGGRQLTVPAFWAGGARWLVRYASATMGVHPYTTQCNDVENPGLHHIQGSVTVTPYEGDNLLLRHGAPKVAADNRHFSYGDGTPFFWLGDTWWLGLTSRLNWPGDFQALAKDRHDKGFTVVQIVAGLYPDMPAFDPRGASLAGFSWNADFTSINPAFFDEADARIMHLVDMGLCPCILGTWGYYLNWLGTEKMKLHWRYIMARWGALPVVFAAAGEQVMPWYLSENKAAESAWLKQEWSKVVRYMREINGFHRLITTHPQTSGRSCVDDPGLLDFEMQQTGHGSPTVSHAARATEGWHAQPEMPVVCGESRYEALEITPEVTTTDARQAFWAHLLNSGCAGHTYGANGVWQVNRENDPFGNSPSGRNWGVTPWRQAMQLPGSAHLARAKALLLTLPWHRLEPIALPSISKLTQLWKKFFKSDLLPSRHQHPVAAAATRDGELALYYFLDTRPIAVDGKPFAHPVDAFWFDPANGNTTPMENTKHLARDQTPSAPPGKNGAGDTDWLLVVKRPG